MYAPGTLLAGKYRVERTLGRGGMGLVIAAEHVELRSQVAIKLLADKYVQRPDVVERFMREARSSAQLRSDHVCRVFDVGRLDDGRPFIVMELLEGRDLAKLLREHGPLDVVRIADYIVQTCDAMLEAHTARIVHRDLKPGNLFLAQRRDGREILKVLDFGVAKAQDEADFSLTGADTVVGSPSYMAPEQIRAAKNADARSDIWSLGVIMHEAACGRQPFNGETIAELAVKITVDPLPPLLGVPPDFAAIVARCLEKEPARRFQSASELASALLPFVAPQTGPVRPPTPLPVPTTGPRPPLASEQVTVVRPSEVVPPASTTLRTASGMVTRPQHISGSRRLLVIGGVAAIGIGIGLALFVSRGGGGTDSAPAAASSPSPAPSPSPSPSPPPPPSPPPAASPSPSPELGAGSAATEPDLTIDPTEPAKPKPKKPTRKTRNEVGRSRI